MTATLRTLLLPALVLSTLAAGSVAHADDKAACLDAAAKGQRLRDTHRLVEAREQLRICAQASCPAVVQSDCASWLSDVEKTMPTVVVTARNAAGDDIADVRVSVDGQALVSRLDGQAVPLNAGLHAFHFEGAGGAVLDKQVMVREGEKNQSIAIVLGAAPAPVPAPAPSPASPAPAPAPAPATGPAPATAPASSGGGSHTLAWVLGGAGVVGLGVGAVFGIVAMNAKSSANCDSTGVCDYGTTSGIKTDALVADVGFIGGGLLLAGGAALLLFSGGHDAATGLHVHVAPSVVAGGGGATLGGRW